MKALTPSAALLSAIFTLTSFTAPASAGTVVNLLPTYRPTGILEYNDGSGYTRSASATVIKPGSVITAANPLYDRYRGWTTNRSYRAAGIGSATKLSGRTAYVLTGYISAVTSSNSTAAFANDLGGLQLWSNVSGVTPAVYTTSSDSLLLANNGSLRRATGWRSSGFYDSQTTKPLTRKFNAWFNTWNMDLGGPIQGGAMWSFSSGGTWVLCGVTISGAIANSTSYVDVRAFDSSAFSLISLLQ